MRIAILAGGTGRRLWPVSRKNLPKQFIDFFGSGNTLLQQACIHADKIVGRENILIITKDKFKNIVLHQLPWLKPEQLLLEPVNRNTAPAAVWAAHRVSVMDGKDGIVAFMPADQLVLNEDRFIKAMEIGADFVKNNDTVLTMGVTPTRPEPGYGYIQVAPLCPSDLSLNGDESAPVGGQQSMEGASIYNVKSFVEKPERDFAEMFIQSGEFLWNTGIYLARAEFFLKQAESFMPDIMRGQHHEGKLNDLTSEEAFIKVNYARYPNLSLDTSILEKMAKRSVLHSDFGWADIGTWHGIYEAVPKDCDGNVVVNSESNVISDNSHHNIISLQDGKVAILSNIDGYIIAEKGNVLVVCPKSDSSKQIRKFLGIIENDDNLSKEV